MILQITGHVPFRPLQDADDPAAATRYVPVDQGSYRVAPGQVHPSAAGRAGRIGLHTTPNALAGHRPRGGIAKRATLALKSWRANLPSAGRTSYAALSGRTNRFYSHEVVCQL